MNDLASPLSNVAPSIKEIKSQMYRQIIKKSNPTPAGKAGQKRHRQI